MALTPRLTWRMSSTCQAYSRWTKICSSTASQTLQPSLCPSSALASLLLPSWCGWTTGGANYPELSSFQAVQRCVPVTSDQLLLLLQLTLYKLSRAAVRAAINDQSSTNIHLQQSEPTLTNICQPPNTCRRHLLLSEFLAAPGFFHQATNLKWRTLGLLRHLKSL